MSNDWFVAHKEGLRQQAERLVERRGFGILAGELYQNVSDTDATECVMTFTKLPNRAAVEIKVTDNGHGFHDLTHAWTMFAPSEKKGDPTKAGRFNLGEKVVLSFCRQAHIHTTSGMVVFDGEGRKEYPRRKREIGTEFWAIIDCTQERFEQLMDYMRKVLVRPGLMLTVNGENISPRQPIKVFTETLQTEIGELLSKSMRKCEIQIYEPSGDEVAMVYELGIPVVETGDRWHYNVTQKVPLNIDRDNVTPAYLRDLRTHVFNHMHQLVDDEDTTTPWVNEAVSDEQCLPEAAEAFRVKKYGAKSVAFDPTNAEANAEAVAHGYTVIPSRGLTPGQRDNLYKAGTLLTSSKAFPTAGKGAYSDDPNAKPVEVVPEEHWSDGMRQIREYVIGLGYRLLDTTVEVRFVNCKSFVGKRWSACYGRGHLETGHFDFNIWVSGRKWFENGVTEDVDDLILHEMGHHYESSHLSEEYYRALTKLGAKLKAAALADPKWFKKFIKEPKRD